MRLAWACIILAAPLCAQVCPPGRILPTDRLSGRLDDSACRLSDSTAYAGYRLDLPVRGNIRIDLTSGADLIVILRDSTGSAVETGAAIRRPLESGVYTLLVNGRVPGEVGEYSVETSFVPERGVMCTAFPSLGLNQSLAGKAGASGCVTPGGIPFEQYNLRTFGSGTLTVSVSSTEFETVLMLRDSGGQLLASHPTQVSVPVDRDSQYQVVVSTADQPGAYQVTTRFQPNDDETCRATMRLTDAYNGAGAITPDSCSAYTAATGKLEYFDYYELAVGAAGLAEFSAASQDFAPVLRLTSAAGETLASAPDGALRLPLSAGEYILQVVSPAALGGAYNMAYSFTAGVPSRCGAVAAALGDTVSGALTPANCRSAAGPSDVYSITLPAAGTLDLNLTAATFAGVLSLRDAKDNLMVSDIDDAGTGTTHVSADLPAGTYTVEAASASGSGTYQLGTSFAAQEIPPCTFVIALDLNSGYVQKLRPGSCRDTDGQFVDLYEFTLPSDSTVLAVMTSSEVAGLLRLTDTSGNVLRQDRDSYAPNDPMIVQFLPAGTYRLAARSLPGTPAGYYEVDLLATPGSRPPFCTAKQGITPGTTIEGTLSYTACQYPDGTFADVYQVTLAKPATIDLRLASAAFLTDLVLLDAAGNVVAEDDSRINLALPAGIYFAVAKPRSDYYHVGGYTLSLAPLQ